MVGGIYCDYHSQPASDEEYEQHMEDICCYIVSKLLEENVYDEFEYIQIGNLNYNPVIVKYDFNPNKYFIRNFNIEEFSIQNESINIQLGEVNIVYDTTTPSTFEWNDWCGDDFIEDGFQHENYMPVLIIETNKQRLLKWLRKQKINEILN